MIVAFQYKRLLSDGLFNLMAMIGIIIKELSRYPSSTRYLLSATSCPLLTNKYKTGINLVGDFLNIMKDKGNIPKEHFDVCGIRTDKDIDGRDVIRSVGIAQESFC